MNNEDLEKRVEKIEILLNQLVRSDRYSIARLLQFLDGRHIIVGTITGTKIGTTATQKLSTYGVPPVVQAGSIAAPATQSVGYVQADVQSIVNAVNSIRIALKNFGITA